MNNLQSDIPEKLSAVISEAYDGIKCYIALKSNRSPSVLFIEDVNGTKHFYFDHTNNICSLSLIELLISALQMKKEVLRLTHHLHIVYLQ